MAKMKTLILTHPHCPLDAPARTYKVVRIKNSIEFNVGQYLLPSEVEELCDAKGWDVSVTAADK